MDLIMIGYMMYTVSYKGSWAQRPMSNRCLRLADRSGDGDEFMSTISSRGGSDVSSDDIDDDKDSSFEDDGDNPSLPISKAPPS